MKKDRCTFVLMFISSFALASIVGYVGIASAQNMSAGSNLTSNATMGNSLNDTGIGTAKELEKLTGNNTQFNNTALSNLTTGISEEMSNITANIVANQSGNQS